MTPDDLIHVAPQLYHMAERDAWESICRHGLLSTTAALDLFEVAGEKRFQLESCHRASSCTIEHPLHGRMVLRDQTPLPEVRLRECLRDGFTPRDWYELLNHKVFFWATSKRLDRLRGAKPYETRQHLLLTISTRELLRRHSSDVTLTTINSGAALFKAPTRGRDTFKPLRLFNYEASRRRREAIAEVAIEYSVPRVAECVLRLELIGGGKPNQTLPMAPLPD